MGFQSKNHHKLVQHIQGKVNYDLKQVKYEEVNFEKGTYSKISLHFFVDRQLEAIQCCPGSGKYRIFINAFKLKFQNDKVFTTYW